MTDAPERIYLQDCGEDDCEEPFSAHHEVTWCEDQIHERDVPYVRADIPEAEMKRRDEQWLELIALCDEHMEKIAIDPFLDRWSAEAWETVSKNLGVARVVIESRLAAPSAPKGPQTTEEGAE